MARSLSITHSTPTSCRSLPFSYMVGMPPPPAAITTVPFSSSHWIGLSWKMRFGSGEGTTRRQLLPSGFTVQPLAFASAFASASS